MSLLLEYWFDVSNAHAVVDVLLVGKNQKRNARQIIVLDHFIEQFFRFVHSIAIVRIDHVDYSVRLVIILK